MYRHLPHSVDAFRKEERGSVMLTFGVMTFVLFFTAGLAIDYGRIQDLRTRMGGAIDAASLAVGRELLNGKLTDEELVQLGKAYFVENAKGSGGGLATLGEPTVKINRATGAVEIWAKAQIAMTLTRLGGFDTVDVPVMSEAVFQQRNIEVGMALDLTGSMKDPIGGKSKLASLKVAFQDFVDTIMPEQDGSAHWVKVALAPYSAGVKLGPYATGLTTGKSVDGCVSEQVGKKFDDNVGKYHVKKDSRIDIDPLDDVGDHFECPPPIVKPLTQSKSDLVAEVNSYTAAGWTSGHLGVQWAWNLISDNWGGVWGGDSKPESYTKITEKKLMKAVVLMTDGAFNTAFHGDTSAKQAVALCTAIKAKEVIVFSVGFGLGSDAKALANLQACATPGDDYFAAAESEEDLKAAFRKFAGTLTKLRLSR